MYPVRTPGIVRTLAPYAVWSIPNATRSVYLTFDDGPTPGVTSDVLDILREYKASATFFCLGKNAERHPDLIERILRHGHHIGHHSQNHLDGWKADHFTYLRDVLRGASQIPSTLYRPPYGRITPRQAQTICKRFRLIMWDIISGDFDIHITPETCVKNVLRHVCPGSIVVFHDSIKAAPRMLYALPRVLEELRKANFNTAPIPYQA